MAIKRPSPAEKQLEQNRVVYVEVAGATMESVGEGERVFRHGDCVSARVTVENDNQVFVEIPFTPGLVETLAQKQKYLRRGKSAGTLGMLESKDPRPGLESNFSKAKLVVNNELKALGARALEGAEARVTLFFGDAGFGSGPPAATDLQASKGLAGLLSSGGPYLVLPEARCKSWKASEAQSLLSGGDGGALVETKAGQALTIGSPDRLLLWQRSESEAWLVSVVSLDSDDEPALAEQLKTLKLSGAKKLKTLLPIEGPLVVFDSALKGADLSRAGSERLVFTLAPGKYEVSNKTERPDAGTELLIVRLKRKE
jgi:hypothetical protein